MMDAAIITALLTPLGVAASFVWRKIEKRIALLEEKVANCEARDLKRAESVVNLTTASKLMLAELRRIDAANPFLTTIETLLRKAWAVDPDVPPDMLNALGELQ